MDLPGPTVHYCTRYEGNRDCACFRVMLRKLSKHLLRRIANSGFDQLCLSHPAWQGALVNFSYMEDVASRSAGCCANWLSGCLQEVLSRHLHGCRAGGVPHVVAVARQHKTCVSSSLFLFLRLLSSNRNLGEGHKPARPSTFVALRQASVSCWKEHHWRYTGAAVRVVSAPMTICRFLPAASS